MSKSAKITLFTLAAASAALGVYLTTPQGRSQTKKVIGNINSYLQTSEAVALLAQKIGLIQKGTQKMVSKSADTTKTAERTINKVLN